MVERKVNPEEQTQNEFNKSDEVTNQGEAAKLIDSKIVFGRTGVGKSTMLNGICSLGFDEGLKKIFKAGGGTNACTNEVIAKSCKIRVPKSGGYKQVIDENDYEEKAI